MACSAAGDVAIVGFGGLKQRLVKGAWIDEFSTAPFVDLHAAWSPAPGEVWAVGGDWIGKATDAPRRGVVAHFGPRDVSTIVDR